MKAKAWLLLVVLGMFLVLPPEVRGSNVLASESPQRSSEAQAFSPTAVTPYGRVIEVSVAELAASDPAAARCAAGQYLVVYERGGDIMGQRLTADGDLLGGAFQVSDGTYAASRPDVACEWGTNLFVVVWEARLVSSDLDLRAQAVYGAHQTMGSQLLGSHKVLAASGSDERNPALACNSDDQTCLAVFESENAGNTSIRGRRIEVAGVGLTLPYGSFGIGQEFADSSPDVAWSGPDNQFMVVWQHWAESVTPPSHYLLVFQPFHDTHQAVNQWQTPPYGLILTSCGYQYDETEPAIAFSRGAGEYLVAYQYDRAGDGTNHDIAATRLQPNGTRACPFFVAETTYSETHPAVAHSGGPEPLPGQPGNPQFLVVYPRQELGETALYAQGVKDREDAYGVQLDGEVRELDRAPATDGVAAPDVTGSAQTGRYLAVWQRNDPHQDILGRLVAPYGGVWSVAGTNFVPASSAFGYEYLSWGGIRLTDLGGASPPLLVAPVQLPEGVTVASLTLYYVDSNATAAIWLDLVRLNGTGGSDSLATAISNDDGTSSVTDASINAAVVDPANYSYALMALVEWSDLVLYGARITYIPNADAPLGPFDTASLDSAGERGTETLDTGLPGEEGGPVLHTGGEVFFLGPELSGDGAIPRAREGREDPGSQPDPGTPDDSSRAGRSAGSFPWRRYTVPGSAFQPLFSNSEHQWAAGGARQVTVGLPYLAAPLNLMHGNRIQSARFTYYDVSDQNPALYLYRVSRQGPADSGLVWGHTPEASGGYFVAASPHLGEPVDNYNYAYYAVIHLGRSAAGSALRVLEVEVSYITEVYLPVVLRGF